MGKIASQKADILILTSDNSRSENPIDIINDIKSGVLEKTEYYIIPEREKAITFAIKILKENDILLLLGKGHEMYEIDKTGEHYFNERDIVRDLIGL